MATEEVFMSGKRYTDEFKIEAVRQVTEHGRPVVEVAQRLTLFPSLPQQGLLCRR